MRRRVVRRHQAKELEILLRRTEAQLEQSTALAATLADENERLRALLLSQRGVSGGGGALHSSLSATGTGINRTSELQAAMVRGVRPIRHSLAVARAAAGENSSTTTTGDLASSVGLAMQPLICPLSRSIMQEPVVALDGWSYERETLAQYWRAKPLSSPKTGRRLQSRAVVPNHALKLILGSLFNASQRGGRPVPFDYLPHEAVQRVFDWLVGSPRALGRMSQVCRYFKEVGDDPARWQRVFAVRGWEWSTFEQRRRNTAQAGPGTTADGANGGGAAIAIGLKLHPSKLLDIEEQRRVV